MFKLIHEALDRIKIYMRSITHHYSSETISFNIHLLVSERSTSLDPSTLESPFLIAEVIARNSRESRVEPATDRSVLNFDDGIERKYGTNTFLIFAID